MYVDNLMSVSIMGEVMLYLVVLRTTDRYLLRIRGCGAVAKIYDNFGRLASGNVAQRQSRTLHAIEQRHNYNGKASAFFSSSLIQHSVQKSVP